MTEGQDDRRHRATAAAVGYRLALLASSRVPASGPRDQGRRTIRLRNADFRRFTDWEGTEEGAEISPDGKFVAFLSDRAVGIR